MAYIPPLNGGRLNASIGGNSTSAGAGYSLLSTGTMFLAGGNNVTLSQNGGSITISAGAAGGSINFSASNTSANLASITFSNSNGVSFGLNAGVMTASHNALTTQSGQALSGSNGSVAFQTATLGNLNGLSFYTSNGSMVGSYTVPTQTNQTLSQAIVGNTTGNTSGMSMDARNLTLQGLGAASVGLSTSVGGSSVIVSAPIQSIQTQNMVSFGGSTGNIVVSNSNNVTFGGAGSIVTASASFNQTNQTLGMTFLGNTTQGSTATVDARSLSLNGLGNVSVGYSNGSVQISGGGGGAALSAAGASASNGTVVFSNSNGVNFGMAGSTITASHNGITSQSVQTQNMVSISGSTGNISFNNGNNVTFGGAGSAITASASFNQTNQTQNVIQGIAASGSTNTSGTVSFANSNGVTFGLSNNTMTASVAVGGGVALSANTLISSGTASLAAQGALTISGSNQTLSLSVPAISSIIGTNGINISTTNNVIYIDGSAISAGTGGGASGTISNWEPQELQFATLGSSSGLYTSNSIYFYKLQPEAYISASQLMQLVSMSSPTSSNSSFAGAISIYAGLYQSTGSSLSLATQSSGSATYGWTVTSNSTASINGLRGLTLPFNLNVSPGNYWLGLLSRFAATTGSTYGISNVVLSQPAISYSGLLGQVANATQGIQEGVGLYGTSSTALPSLVPFSSISQSTLRAMPYLAFKNITW